jgi:hypothetical protein
MGDFRTGAVLRITEVLESVGSGDGFLEGGKNESLRKASASPFQRSVGKHSVTGTSVHTYAARDGSVPRLTNLQVSSDQTGEETGAERSEAGMSTAEL